MKGKTILFALLALIVVGAAWKISEERAPRTEIERRPLYPELLERLNDVTRIELRSAAHRTELAREGERWVLVDKDGFPAEAGGVRRAVLQIAGLRVVEPKTRLPERFARLGVQDVEAEGAEGTRVELFDASGASLAALVVGHSRDLADDPQHYVRRAGEEQTWLVEGELAIEADPIPWLDARIVDIDTERVREVRVEVPDAPPILITKDERNDNFFALQNVPDGYEPKSKATVSSLGALLLDLRFNDVASAERVGDAAVRRTVTVRTFDGLVVTLRDYAIDEQTFTAFEFAYDEAGVVPEAEPAAEEAPAGEPAGEAAAALAASDEDASEGTEEQAKESAAEAAERLTARTAGWIYVLPDYKRRMIERDFESLIEEAEDEQAAAE